MQSWEVLKQTKKIVTPVEVNDGNETKTEIFLFKFFIPLVVWSREQVWNLDYRPRIDLDGQTEEFGFIF